MENQILADFGLHLKKLRSEAKISQEALALKCELDRTYISGIERGKRNVSLLNIVKIARALSVPVSDLFVFMEDCK